MGAKYQAYQDYKNSDVDLLMDVPTHWIVGRYKFCTDRIVVGIAEAATHAYADEGVPIIRSTNIREGGLDTNGLLFIKSEFAEKNDSKYLYENDIITVRTGYPGVSSVIPKYLNKSQCFTNLVATPKNVFVPEFLAHYLNSHAGKEYFDLLGWGSAQKNISVPILQNIPIAYPSKNEQEIIVNFLDHETAKIDTLIEKQQQLIKLLKEKRQAVISHAVTKGLNPNAPMRDSGVEWLGEVPEHWERISLNYLIAHTVDNRGRTPPVIAQGIPMCEVSQVAGDGFYTSKNYSKFITQESYDQFVRSDVEEDDVLFVTVGATFGKTCLVPPSPDFFIAQNVVGFRCEDNVDSKFFMFLLSSSVFKEAISATNKSSTIDNVKVSDLVKTRLVIPPHEEQIEIANHIFAIVDQYEKLVFKAESVISLMQERRTALISAAVTGKIDVRNWKAPTPSTANNKEVAA